MALRTDKAVEVFSALALNTVKDSEIEVAEARAAIRELSSNPNPNNRFELSQLMAFVVNNIINQKTNYINMFADTKTVGYGEKALFKIKKAGIKAYLQAKNGTTHRSRIMNAYQDVDTIEVSARPYVNLLELASGKVNFDECINDAADEMEKKMVQAIEATLYAAFSGYSTPNYGSGSGVVAATIDPMIRAMQRVGKTSIIGDISAIYKLAELSGFTTTTSTVAFADSQIQEFHANGWLGNYKGSNVIKLDNPFERGSLTTTILDQGLLYIVPAGAVSPLKVVMEGDVTSMEGTNMNDNTMEVQLRKMFGSAVIYGDYPEIAVYSDSSL